MLITIIIPAYNESKYIDDCILSLYNMVLPESYDIEVLVVDGSSSDNTCDIVKSLMDNYDSLRLLENPKRKTPFGLNIGINAAKGEMIVIASAHSRFEKDYLHTLIIEKQNLDADVVGGVMKAIVKNKTTQSSAIETILSSSFGIGNSLFRTGIYETTEVDTVPYGLYDRKLLLKANGYDERLTRNHDIELSKRLKSMGAKIYLIPNAVCYYYARENFGEMAKNSFKNGYWNILTLYITKRFSSLATRHFVPFLFICSLIIPLLLSYYNSKWLLLSLVSLVSYLLFLFINVSRVVGKHKDSSFLQIVIASVCIHFSYGLGSLIAVFRVDRLLR